LDLIPFLSKSGSEVSGSKETSTEVSRGWHTVTVTPDALTRVEFDLVTQLFANSRGGGQY
jgi:hypothetical protein